MLSETWSLLKLPGRRLFPLLCRKQLVGKVAGGVLYLHKHIGVCACNTRSAHTHRSVWERVPISNTGNVSNRDACLTRLYIQKDPQLSKVELSSLYVNNWYIYVYTIFICISRSASFSPNEQHLFPYLDRYPVILCPACEHSSGFHGFIMIHVAQQTSLAMYLWVLWRCFHEINFCQQNSEIATSKDIHI